MAGITAALASQATPSQAACIGNLAAAVCAAKLHQTGTATPAEIRDQMLPPPDTGISG